MNQSFNSATLIRWSGLAALTAGLTFAAIQPVHPPDVLASVTTHRWALITPVKTLMCGLFLLGLAGIHARQLRPAVWPGLTGLLLLGLSWALQLAFVFTEAFILPLLTRSAPTFVDAYLGLARGQTSDVNLGALPNLYTVVGVTYVLGGLTFGLATVRAGVLPRWTGVLLAVASALTPLAALLPHASQRFAAIPVGLAVAGMGWAVWQERPSRSDLSLDPATSSRT